MTGIVAAITGMDVYYVFERMPLSLVFSYEHFYYVQNGYVTLPRDWKNSLADVVRAV